MTVNNSGERVMRKLILNAIALLVTSMSTTMTYAEDGGLMAEMMAKRYPTKVVSGSQVQERLALVNFIGETHQNGGLMKVMMEKHYPEKIVNDKVVQQHLTQVVIHAGSNH